LSQLASRGELNVGRTRPPLWGVGQMPDIRLDDPHDETKLVELIVG